MRNQTLENYLEDLASKQPAPGGGAAAAFSGAQGAALIEMVCGLSIGKEKYKEHEAELMKTSSRATDIRSRCLELAEEDKIAFTNVMKVYRSKENVQRALMDAAEPPHELAQLAIEISKIAERTLPISNSNVASDLEISMLLATATLESSILNIEANLKHITDEAFATDKRKLYLGR